jgi:hypothetical protein
MSQTCKQDNSPRKISYVLLPTAGLETPPLVASFSYNPQSRTVDIIFTDDSRARLFDVPETAAFLACQGTRLRGLSQALAAKTYRMEKLV